VFGNYNSIFAHYLGLVLGLGLDLGLELSGLGLGLKMSGLVNIPGCDV